jgi:hypothetical protein
MSINIPSVGDYPGRIHDAGTGRMEGSAFFGGPMPSNSEYAQKQFRTEKAENAEREKTRHELRILRSKVKALEEKVSSLSHELSLKNVIGVNKREFS